MALDDSLLIPTPPPPEPTEKKPHRWTVVLSFGALVLAGVSAFYAHQQANEAHQQTNEAHQARIDTKKASDAQAKDVDRSRTASENSAIAAGKLAEIAQNSLNVAEHSAKAAERNTRIAATPYIEIIFAYNETGAGWTYLNMGQGIAMVRSFEVLVDGHRLRTWDQIVDLFDLPTNTHFSVPLPGTAVLPFKTGDKGEIFWVPPPTGKLVKLSKRVRISTCYCSVYGDCWKTGWGSSEAPPRQVASCEVIPPAERFGVKEYLTDQ